jgi:superfamily II RNA helicase
MAGRAGRRGKDTEGWVFYLPDREPSSLNDVRTMMTGKVPRVTSKMDFGYDTILACALSGQTVTANSLWAREQDDEVARLEADKAALGEPVFLPEDPE